MTIAELAKELNATIPVVFEHYRKISADIPQDENYVLTNEQITKARLYHEFEQRVAKKNLENKLKPKPVPRQIEDIKSKLIERRTKRVEILDNLEPFFKKGERELLKEIKNHNSIPDFIFEGDYRKIEGNSFGFFKNIAHQNGSFLTYPVSKDSVDEIFIPTGELTNGKRYSFEALIARRHERTKKANPFLLQAKTENIKEIIELSAISQELKIKQEKLEVIKAYLEKAEDHFEEKKSEVEEKVSKVCQQKQEEANSIIEKYNETINQKFNEIQTKEKELTSLNEIVEKTNNNLQKMENLLSTLKDRVSLCRNLQFITEDDENKYLNLLSAKEFNPINHLDFEKDFENNFSKLVEHIHAYLYHKKNLIYTQYQIKNFLTLIKTHDIIVLSGLSGSGKTQIVKAFAEALGGVAKIIPVKPNWTSSDDLIGYYNPLQMSFLPTPFTEAIVEAINNPNQLYFICLDEMNLARAEYYFADFLSKLEERSKQPEIELYANHEEELFVSEFSTLLNLIESSIKGKQIKSWQEFLDNEEARKKFFALLGNTEKESMLQLHAKMKRRLIDILKFPSTIKIPDNVRFIGAINVDETTHYFSPKILDRIHVVKFDNPLLFEEEVNSWFETTETEKELIPVYVHPILLAKREEYPRLNSMDFEYIKDKLKEINQLFLLPLGIDFGIRSIRQSINYNLNLMAINDLKIAIPKELRDDIEGFSTIDISVNRYSRELDYPEERIGIDKEALNSVINQKILPRFVFDGSDISKSGKSKIDIVEELKIYLSNELNFFNDTNGLEIGKGCYQNLTEMITNAKNSGNSQFNFFA